MMLRESGALILLFYVILHGLGTILVYFIPLLIITALLTFIIYLLFKKKNICSTVGAILVTIFFILFIIPIYPGYRIAEEECENFGKNIIGNPITVEGYLARGPTPGLGSNGSISYAKNLLLEKNFQYFESPIHEGPILEYIEGEGNYLRFYLDKVESKYCALYPIQLTNNVEKIIQNEKCIAVKRVEEIQSDYEEKIVSQPERVRIFSQLTFPYIEIPWMVWQIIERKTGEVKSQIKTFEYKAYLGSYFCQNSDAISFMRRKAVVSNSLSN